MRGSRHIISNELLASSTLKAPRPGRRTGFSLVLTKHQSSFNELMPKSSETFIRCTLAHAFL
jgi:hypothetical protein